MSAFEFTFSLFGLLLGFSLLEVLGGLARTIEARLRPKRKIAGGTEDGAEVEVAGTTALAGAYATGGRGWLTPLLGVFVMLDIISFWNAAWVVRDQLSVSSAVLLGGMFFTGSYYLAAHLVFPREPGEWADLDEHYYRVRRIVLGALLALLAVQLAYYLSVPSLAQAFENARVLISIAAFVLLLIAAMLVRGKAANTAVLALLIARYVWESVT